VIICTLWWSIQCDVGQVASCVALRWRVCCTALWTRLSSELHQSLHRRRHLRWHCRSYVFCSLLSVSCSQLHRASLVDSLRWRDFSDPRSWILASTWPVIYTSIFYICYLYTTYENAEHGDEAFLGQSLHAWLVLQIKLQNLFTTSCVGQVHLTIIVNTCSQIFEAPYIHNTVKPARSEQSRIHVIQVICGRCKCD